MRNIFIIGMLLVGASLAGWFTIEHDGEDTGIKFDTSEIRNDIGKLREKGRDYLDRREQQREANRIEGTQADFDSPAPAAYDERFYDAQPYGEQTSCGFPTQAYPAPSPTDDWRRGQTYDQAELRRDDAFYSNDPARRSY